jgi:hypothetical protein
MTAGTPSIVSAFARSSFAPSGSFALIRRLQCFFEFLLVRQHRVDSLLEIRER